MANGYPSLEELIAARRTPGPGEAIQSGLEGFMAGRKRRTEEETTRATNVLNQAKLRLQQQGEQREERQLTAGLIPADRSLTGQEQTPEVQKSLKPETIEYDKIGESDEGGNKFILMSPKSDPKTVVRVPAGQTKEKTPAALLNAKLKAAGPSFLDEAKRAVGKMPEREGLIGAGSALKFAGQNLAQGFAGGDPELLSFETSRPTAGRRIYKELSGDVGNIAEKEGGFAEALVPSSTVSSAINKERIARLERLYAGAEKRRQEVLAQAQANNFTKEQTEELMKASILGLMASTVASPAATEAAPATPEAAPASGVPQIKILRRRPAGS